MSAHAKDGRERQTKINAEMQHKRERQIEREGERERQTDREREGEREREREKSKAQVFCAAKCTLSISSLMTA